MEWNWKTKSKWNFSAQPKNVSVHKFISVYYRQLLFWFGDDRDLIWFVFERAQTTLCVHTVNMFEIDLEWNFFIAFRLT